MDFASQRYNGSRGINIDNIGIGNYIVCSMHDLVVIFAIVQI